MLRFYLVLTWLLCAYCGRRDHDAVIQRLADVCCTFGKYNRIRNESIRRLSARGAFEPPTGLARLLLASCNPASAFNPCGYSPVVVEERMRLLKRTPLRHRAVPVASLLDGSENNQKPLPGVAMSRATLDGEEKLQLTKWSYAYLWKLLLRKRSRHMPGAATSGATSDGEKSNQLSRWMSKLPTLFASVRSLCRRIARVLQEFAQRVANTIRSSKKNTNAEPPAEPIAVSPASRTKVPLPKSSDDIPSLGSSDDSGPNMEIRWLDPAEKRNSTPSVGALTLPVFPFSRLYLPWQRPVFNIVEPRHIKMYNDIIFSGARRFLICRDDPTRGVAEVGTLVYLEDLTAGDELRGQKVKYIGNHSVIGRARIVKVLSEDGDYPVVEVQELQDIDMDEDTADAEAEIRKTFVNLIDMQAKVGEKPRFFPEFKNMLDFSRGSDFNNRGFWGTLGYWQVFQEQRQNRYLEFELEEMDKEVAKGNNGEQLLREFEERYQDFAEDIDPYSLRIQAILQSTSHRERLSIFRYLVNNELRRLMALAAVKQAFEGGSGVNPD